MVLEGDDASGEGMEAVVHTNEVVAVGPDGLVFDVGEDFVVHDAILPEGDLLEGGSEEGNEENNEQGDDQAGDEYFPPVFHYDSNIYKHK